MKPQAINYEVLFFTNTHFSSKQICKKKCNDANHSPSDQLQNACWNGMAFEIIPDIVHPFSAKENSYTWEVIPAKNFIEIKIGVSPCTVENSISLNPYLFVSAKNLN